MRRSVETASQPGHGSRGPVNVDGTVELAACPKGPLRGGGPLRPEDLPALGVASVRRTVEQLSAVELFAQDVLLSKVERRDRLQLAVAGTLTLDYQGDLPGAGTDRHLDLLTQHPMAYKHH